ncbi:tetratricopeptide repeat protein [bacterium]|nr:tetratricopeptide repeat protein [bacterium]
MNRWGMNHAGGRTWAAALGLAALGLAALIGAQVARAECQPGQMQEANLAYQSAKEFLDTQNWDQALARLQSIVSVCPEHVEATRGIGTALMGKEQFALAVPAFQKVIQLRGQGVQAGDFDNLARAYARQKLYKEARAEYMKAEQLAPDDCGLLFNLAAMHDAVGFSTQAVDVCQHLLDLDAECPKAQEKVLVLIAKAAGKASEQQKRAGNNQRAQYYLEMSQQYGGQAGGSTTADVAKQKMKSGDYAEAAGLYEAMLAKNPELTNAWLNLARAKDQAGDRPGSITAYGRYLALKPTDTTEWGAMLQVMVEAGRCGDAAAQAAKAFDEHRAKGHEAVAPILFSWGLALECQKDYDAARTRFSQCAESGSARYSAAARRQVARMEGLKAVAEAERKKAAGGR